MAVASAFAEAFEKSVANRIRRIRVTIDQPFSVCDARDRGPVRGLVFRIAKVQL